MARKRTFGRTADGALTVALYEQEIEALAMMAGDMLAIVEAPPEGQVRDRLYPRAYLDPTEETAQVEYDALVHDDLVGSRRAAFQAIITGLARAQPNKRGLFEVALQPDEELQWLTALNDARLVIGTALGVTDEDDTEYPPDDPRFEFGVLYDFLTGVHSDLVELLLGEIGEAGSDDDPETRVD
jgi:hypothetical protein